MEGGGWGSDGGLRGAKRLWFDEARRLLVARIRDLDRSDLGVELTRHEGVRLVARAEGLVLDLPELRLAGSVPALQIEVFADRVVENAHMRGFARPRRVKA